MSTTTLQRFGVAVDGAVMFWDAAKPEADTPVLEDMAAIYRDINPGARVEIVPGPKFRVVTR